MSEEFKGVIIETPSLQSLPNGYSTHVSYLLWYGIGYIGAHNFYLKRIHLGIIFVILFIVGLATIPVKFGVIPLSILAVLLVIDFIRIPKIVKSKNSEILRQQNDSDASL